MQRYKAIKGNTGVVAFSAGRDYIKIQFRDGSIYLYDYNIPGMSYVEKMKQLAVKGKGLTTYINQYIRDKYAVRIR